MLVFEEGEKPENPERKKYWRDWIASVIVKVNRVIVEMTLNGGINQATFRRYILPSAVVLEVYSFNSMIIWPPKLLLEITKSIWSPVLLGPHISYRIQSSVNSLSRGFSVLQAHVLQRQRGCTVAQLQEDGPWSCECIPPRGRSFSVYKERFISIEFF